MKDLTSFIELIQYYRDETTQKQAPRKCVYLVAEANKNFGFQRMDWITYHRYSESSDWSRVQWKVFASSSSKDSTREGRLLVLLRTRRRQYVNCIIHIGRSKTRRHARRGQSPPTAITTRLFRRFAGQWLRRMSATPPTTEHHQYWKHWQRVTQISLTSS